MTPGAERWARTHHIDLGPKRRGKTPRPRSGRPTATELERRMDHALAMATNLFIEQGFAGTGHAQIAHAAGVSTRTLYQHLGDKESIFWRVIRARDLASAHGIAMEPGDTLASLLTRAGGYAYDVTYATRSIGLMRLMIAESTRFPDTMKAIATSTFAVFRKNIELIFVAAERAGLIPPGDHARTADLFGDVVLGSNPIMAYTNWNSQRPGADDLEERVALFILGRFGAAVAATSRTKTA